MDKVLESRIKMVMSSIFGIPEKDITDDASPDNIKSWDSLKHMSLIIALEEEFLIDLSDEDIVEMINFKLIVNILANSFRVNED